MPPRTLYARAIAVDSSGFIALLDPQDAGHDAATQFIDAAQRLALPLITTIPTIHETHQHLLYNMGAALARSFLTAVFDGSITVERTTAEDDARGVALLYLYADVELSFVDAVTMAVMERLGIATVFSFDDDYFIAGFLRVPPLYL